MGLVTSSIRYILREHRRSPLIGPVLLLGRQDVYATTDEILELMRQENVVPQALISDLSDVPSDRRFFMLLGLESQALDVTDYEGADIIADLNQEIPASLQGQFGTVLDPGTLEHVFDIRRSFMNIGALLTENGRVIHISPVNNWVNHGFYQFSPTLFADYYRANNYSAVSTVLFEQDIDEPNTRPWVGYELDPLNQPSRITSSHALGIAVSATKTAMSTTDRIPMQTYYERLGEVPEPQSVGITRRVAQGLPAPVKRRLKRLLRVDPLRRPWGLRRIS